MTKSPKWSLAKIIVLVGAGLILCLPAAVGASQDPDTGGGGSISNCTGTSSSDCFLERYVNPFIKLLTGAFGLFAAISLVVAGVQYSSARDDPSAVEKAKTRILNTVLGVVAYIFLLAFLNYIIPGGLI